MKETNKKFTDFYEAFHFLNEHALFEGDYAGCLYIEVVKVDPKTDCIERERERNTETRVWFEAGAPGTHDLELDCGGATYEEATIELANLVYEKYGEEQTEPRPWICEVLL